MLTLLFALLTPPGAWLPVPALSDDFNPIPLAIVGPHGTTVIMKDVLDFDKWNTFDRTGAGWFMPSNVKIQNGLLNLLARKTAAVESKTSQLYGYFEARMQTAGVSSFWLSANDGAHWSIINIAEFDAGNPRADNLGVRLLNDPTVAEFGIPFVWTAPVPLNAGYHTYGLDWEADTIRWYVDGAEVWEQPNTNWHTAMTVNFDCTGLFNSILKVDWVRVWTH